MTREFPSKPWHHKRVCQGLCGRDEFVSHEEAAGLANKFSFRPAFDLHDGLSRAVWRYQSDRQQPFVYREHKRWLTALRRRAENRSRYLSTKSLKTGTWFDAVSLGLLGCNPWAADAIPDSIQRAAFQALEHAKRWRGPMPDHALNTFLRALIVLYEEGTQKPASVSRSEGTGVRISGRFFRFAEDCLKIIGILEVDSALANRVRTRVRKYHFDIRQLKIKRKSKTKKTGV